jgi:hypothetical protein
MRRALPILLAALLLTGCAQTPDEPDAALPPEPTDEADTTSCLDLSPAAIAALQHGLDEKGAGYTIDQAAAIKGEDSWWVGAHVTGDPDVTAVWNTIHDPTVDADNAYTSATELASLVSYYAMPEDLTGADPVNAAIDCLP